MKKRLLTVLVLLGIILPYGQSIVYAVAQQEPLAENQLKLQTDTTEKQTVLDEDYAKVTASYVETETNYQWTIEFEKKASQNESRIRIAIDTTANGFGTVSDIRGQGLSSADADSDELKAMKVENDEKELDWYYGEVYSNSAEKGTLSFTSEKISDDSGELPLVVAVDQQTSETSDTEQSTDATEEQTVETVEQTTETDGTSEQTSESTEQTTETTEEITEETTEAANGTRFYRSVALPFANGVGLKPFSAEDPFGYSVKLPSQQRYLNHATNEFATAGNFISDGKYSTEQGNLYNGEHLFTDDESLKNGQIVAGGANWRNYDYAREDSAFEVGGKIAKTTQVWGDEGDRNFTNSYLDYNGAYLKKWVEPVVSDDATHDSTTTYNVYLDVIGETIQNKKPIDIVFVLDKSGSMDEKLANSQKKYAAMQNALETTVTKLFDDNTLDLRVGFVDFGSHGFSKMTSNTFNLSGDGTKVLDKDENTVLFGKLDLDNGGSATPLSLGIKNGYAELYRDVEQRQAEKILIIVGDGMPTFSYSGFRHRTSNNSSRGLDWDTSNDRVSGYWQNDRSNQFIRNYENLSYDGYSAAFNSNERYPTNFNPDDRPANYQDGRRYHYYRFGETDEMGSQYWFGTGTPTGGRVNGVDYSKTDAQNYNKANAVQTIAYHHWVRDKYAKNKGITPRVFSIGLGLNGGKSEKAVFDALGRNVLKNIADLKSNPTTRNESHYYDADSEDDLVTALTGIASELTRTIQDATLTDILGDNVSVAAGEEPKINFYRLNKTNGNYSAPTAWTEQTPNVTSTSSEAGYTFNGITLGTGEMMRISYQVTLDDNETAQNGKFQTVNKEAYLVNGSNNPTTERMYFPSPSIRYLKKQLTNDLDFLIKKVDENNNPLNGVGFELTKEGENEAVYKAYSGIHDYDVDSGNPTTNDEGLGAFYLKEGGNQDFTQRLKLTVGKYTVTETEPLLAYISAEKEFEFEVNEYGKFSYDTEKNFNLSEDEKTLTLTVVNKVKPLALEFTKIDSHTNRPVEGAEFTIQKWNADKQDWGESIPIVGESSFSYEQLEIGSYKIVEVSSPNGYRAFPGYIILDVFVEDGAIKAEYAYWTEGDNGPEIVEGSKQPATVTPGTGEDENMFLITFDVENDPVVPLPSTGGQGRMVYYAITALIVSAMLILGLYYYRRTQRRGE